MELANKLPSLRAIDYTGNILDSDSVKAEASQAFSNLIFLNGEALTLTLLLEELISANSEVEDGKFLEVACTEPKDIIHIPENEEIGFMNNTTSHLEG